MSPDVRQPSGTVGHHVDAVAREALVHMPARPRGPAAELGHEGGQESPLGAQIAEILPSPHSAIGRPQRVHRRQRVLKEARTEFGMYGLDGNTHRLHAVDELAQQA